MYEEGFCPYLDRPALRPSPPVHEAAARKGCSARKLVLAGIKRAVEEAKSTRPSRRLSLDPPLIRPAGRRIRITNEQAYELIELP